MQSEMQPWRFLPFVCVKGCVGMLAVLKGGGGNMNFALYQILCLCLTEYFIPAASFRPVE